MSWLQILSPLLVLGNEAEPAGAWKVPLDRHFSAVKNPRRGSRHITHSRGHLAMPWMMAEQANDRPCITPFTDHNDTKGARVIATTVGNRNCVCPSLHRSRVTAQAFGRRVMIAVEGKKSGKCWTFSAWAEYNAPARHATGALGISRESALVPTPGSWSCHDGTLPIVQVCALREFKKAAE